MAAADVAEVGKSIGVLVKVDQTNRFSVLSKAGKDKQPTQVGSKGRGGGLVVCKSGSCSLVSRPVSLFGRGIPRGKCAWAMRSRSEARPVGLFGGPTSDASREAGVCVWGLQCC
ncbi:hypothetical protein QL285_092762 [Trifolium repens]|nr:hypothetical protein QL285_092762 [Trifolium repens]